MTPELMARLVAQWVRFYTRGLPGPIAQRRIEEIDADLHDHIAHERAAGTGERRIALGLASRMIRGLAADASWRSRTIARHPTAKESMKMSRSTSRSVARVVLATAFILLLPLVATLSSDDAGWSAVDFVLAGALVAGTGTLLELAARQPAKLAYRLAAGAVGVAAIVFGEVDDAPGLVLFGGLLILGMVVLTLRTVHRSA
jgi:hypothetical protein